MFEKVTLEGQHVRLEPLKSEHKVGLCDAIRDGELWNLFYTSVPHPDDIDQFIAKAEQSHINNEGLTFVTIDKSNNKIVGSTRYLNSDVSNKRTEIGFTFLAQSVQKSHINTEAKLLMLSHAFESLKMNRVAFLTHFLNKNSQRAILRLGAKEEGMLRNHVVMPNGTLRDTMVYSILCSEWPSIKVNLEFKLSNKRYK